MDRALVIKPTGWYYVWEAIKAFLLLAVLGVLIGILVCLCQLKVTAEDIHSLVNMVKPLLPCLANEFCPPPV